MKLSDIPARYRKRTIARDLIIWLTLAIMSVITVQGLIYYSYSSIAYENKLNARAVQVADEFATVMSLPLWNLDTDMIRQISEAYLMSEYISGIRVSARQNENMLFELLPRDSGNLIRKEKTVRREGKEIGKAELIFTRESITHMQKTMIQTILLISFSVIMIIVLGIHFIMKSLLNRPLEQFIRGIRTISDGNYQHALSPVPQSDINEIVSEVNVMSEHIATRTEMLRKEMAERARAERRLAETQALLTAAIDQSAAGIIIVDAPDMNILIANSAALHLRGMSGKPLGKIALREYSKHWLTFDSDGTPCNFNELPLFRAVRRGEVSRNLDLIVRQHSAGEDRWISANATPIRNAKGDIVAGIVVFNDVTEQKNAEEALKRSRDDLEERVRERTAALSKANEELVEAKELAEAATRAKSEFLANMSHEIRTPLNGVIAAADLAMSEERSPVLDRYLRIIHSSASTLLDIVNDILDFSKIEAGKLELDIRPFHLDAVTGSVADMFAEKAARKDIELLVDVDLDTPKCLMGDPLRLGQVLTNLVGNALKFTEKGVIHIGVRNGPAAQGKAELTFFVRDTGVGIPRDRLDSLFDAFIQADASTTRKYGGTGLGLSICKHLLRLMGGDISAESEPGKGSVFSFTLAFERGPERAEKPFVLPKDLRNAPVLLVDDCREGRIVMKSILESFGHRTETAKSGTEAIAILTRREEEGNPFRLMIVDWLMPGMNGIETSVKIRRELGLPIPIIMMTAFGRDGERQDAEKAQVDAFLTKPVSRSVLFNTILEVFGKDEFVRENREPFRIATKSSLARKRIRGARILVVEDNKTNQEIMTAILESADISVSIANNGMECLGMLDDETFDGILMDVQMPVLDGYETTREIRKRGIRRLASDIRIPIIAMTAHAMKGDQERCLDAGMDGYVAKPIRHEKLFHILGRFVRPGKPGRLPKKGDSGSRAHPGSGGNLPDILPGIDVEGTLKRLCVSRSVLKGILAGFFERNRETMEKIRESLGKKDWNRAAHLAHSLKGSAGNIGARELRDAACRLERALKNRKEDFDPAPLASDLESRFLRVMTSLESLSRGSRPDREPPAALPSDENVGPLLRDFFQAIDTADPVAISDKMEELGRHVRAADMEELGRQIADYEYDAAKKTLEKISTAFL